MSKLIKRIIAFSLKNKLFISFAAILLITWGIIASLTGLVNSPAQFYTIRFLLGLAEAGFVGNHEINRERVGNVGVCAHHQVVAPNFAGIGLGWQFAVKFAAGKGIERSELRPA